MGAALQPTEEDPGQHETAAEDVVDQTEHTSSIPEDSPRCRGQCNTLLSGTQYTCLLCSTFDSLGE